MDTRYFLVRFARKSGKIDTTLEAGYGPAMLKLWALEHTTKTKDTIVFDSDGTVLAYYEGAVCFPTVAKDFEPSIEAYCPGLLNACLAD